MTATEQAAARLRSAATVGARMSNVPYRTRSRPQGAVERIEVGEGVLDPGSKDFCHGRGVDAVDEAMIEGNAQFHRLADDDAAVLGDRCVADGADGEQDGHARVRDERRVC